MNDPQKKNVTPLHHAKLNAIQHYLSFGNFAWWMPIRTNDEIEAMYLDLVQSKPKAVQLFWLNVKNKSQAIKRFTTHFSKPTVQRTLQLLNATFYHNSIPLIKEVINLQEKNQVLSLPTALLDQLVWETAFVHTIQTLGNPVNTLQFTFFLILHRHIPLVD